MLSSSVNRSRWGSERELVIAAARGEDGAHDVLVETFLPRIANAARIYRHNRAVSRNELIQDGVVGLFRALERYDASLGTPFWAYASWWVRQAMQHLVAEMAREVVLSDRALRRLSRIKDTRTSFLRTHNREPTVQEMMDACGCAREDVERLLAAEMPARRLEEPSSLGDGAGETVGERLADETSGDDFDAVVDRTRLLGLHERCEVLSERERHVVYAHFGLKGDARTLRDIAGDLSLSVERVRQIEERALATLREELAPQPAGTECPVLRPVDPGRSPGVLRARLARELEAEHCQEGAARNLVVATHEITAGVWLRGRAPQLIRVGRACDTAVCEVSDPAAGPLSRAGAAIVARVTSRVDRFASAGGETFRLWV
ncbi:MAG TPA: sigma-70 family RNA polymerase sigma factor [Thermoleophilaceae bacterium]|nr:sigma-70 family RNA polymerase sigma factor [Thermoleophilaceae bacterium]